jgi:cytochrome bd ubiquinol oxidase subunit II
MISLVFLQYYWWIIVSLLGSLLVFLMFVQGGQSFIFSLPGTEMQRTMIVNTLGRKWEFTFTTLVTFGGAFFASFPLFYATSFGGAYWVWTAILFSFIIQAVAYEFRSKPSNVFGQKTFDMFLFINGAIGPLLIGTAVGTFFTGSAFTLDDMNKVRWATGWHGLEAVLDARNLALGLAVLFLVRTNGLMYLINSIDDNDLMSRSIRKLWINASVFLVFFLFFLISILLSEGFAVTSEGVVFMEKFKYLHNLTGMPVALTLFLAGVVAVLWGIAVTLLKGSRKGIWFSGSGTVAVVFILLIITAFNNTAFYPSFHNLQASLTLKNASSSLFTLKTMMFVSFLIPFVLGYIWYAWKSINNKAITENEMKEGEHIY